MTGRIRQKTSLGTTPSPVISSENYSTICWNEKKDAPLRVWGKELNACVSRFAKKKFSAPTSSFHVCFLSTSHTINCVYAKMDTINARRY